MLPFAANVAEQSHSQAQPPLQLRFLLCHRRLVAAGFREEDCRSTVSRTASLHTSFACDYPPKSIQLNVGVCSPVDFLTCRKARLRRCHTCGVRAHNQHVNSGVSAAKKRKDGMPVGKPFPKGKLSTPEQVPAKGSVVSAAMQILPGSGVHSINRSLSLMFNHG
jgi:hypothetical protein